MPKSYKKKSIVADSPAMREHEAMLEQVLNAPADIDTAPASSAPTSSIAGDSIAAPAPGSVNGGSAAVTNRPASVGVFSQHQYEPMKNVQTRVPLSVYEKLNRMKYFSGKATSIGDIVLQAINEYVDRHPVG